MRRQQGVLTSCCLRKRISRSNSCCFAVVFSSNEWWNKLRQPSKWFDCSSLESLYLRNEQWTSFHLARVSVLEHTIKVTENRITKKYKAGSPSSPLYPIASLMNVSNHKMLTLQFSTKLGQSQLLVVCIWFCNRKTLITIVFSDSMFYCSKLAMYFIFFANRHINVRENKPFTYETLLIKKAGLKS